MSEANQPKKTGRSGALPWWFLLGFVPVLVGMLLFFRIEAWSPAGDTVIECTLWQYYMMEYQHFENSIGNPDSTTESRSSAVLTVVQHLLCAMAGGLLTLGIGSMVQRLIRR